MGNINNKSINNLRVLSCQLIENASSGHPGICLGASPIIYALYSKHLKVSPKDPENPMRDRFVLSAGHGSAMLYSNLYLFGYDYSVLDLQNFRKFNSICAGHPELNVKLGIESSTGPLGQGVANAVGMAIAERHMSALFNKADAKIVDNYTYALVGDGCLMEGVANEALSLAGTLKLNKLIVLYDFNKITIDGRIDEVFRQNTKQVHLGYGFDVIEVKNGNNVKEINRAIRKAKKSKDKPTLIMVNSIIGFGSVLADSERAHGSPLGKEAMQQLQITLGIDTKPFEVLPDVMEHFEYLRTRFVSVEKNFKSTLDDYIKKYPDMYEEYKAYIELNYEDSLDVLKPIKSEKEYVSTRELGGIVLNTLADNYSNILGGSADLSSSTKTVIKTSGRFSDKLQIARNIMFGVREFGMSAITNGISLYGGLTPFCSTFLAFSDYMKAGIRMSAFMGLKALYIFTHDSIGIGEDGPTHQSVEQLVTLRSTPNLVVFRPGNLEETKASYHFALNSCLPTAIILTRQNILNYKSKAKDALLGGYILASEEKNIDAIIIATGSEVELALKAKEVLFDSGVDVRVVSMPSMEVFESQPESYRNKVLPKGINNIISIEASDKMPWYKYVKTDDAIIGVDTFGFSGSAKELFDHFKITHENLCEVVLNTMKKNKKIK